VRAAWPRASWGGSATGSPRGSALRTRLDPDTYGGAYLLGLRGLAVIAHGNSSSTAVANAIRYGARGVAAGVVGRVGDRLAARVGEAAAP
jgi:fatty acid/phospholipid biosynthesis enzyme